MKKIPTISSICERGGDGNYTYNALLYQDILGYSTMHNDTYPEFKTFTVWELTGYLIDHFLPFINEFKELSKRNTRRYRILSKLDGNFTDEAVLYQDILKYAKVIKKSKDNENSNDYSFSLWELTKWLRHNHKNYVDRYNMKPLSNVQIEIESLQKGIKSKVDNFIRLDLIKPIGTRQSKKGRGEITLYTYTEFGFLFAWILENDKEDKAKIISEVYDLEPIPKIDRHIA